MKLISLSVCIVQLGLEAVETHSLAKGRVRECKLNEIKLMLINMALNKMAQLKVRHFCYTLQL
jgi:hypothetical protein